MSESVRESEIDRALELERESQRERGLLRELHGEK